jgi:nitrate/nitrite transport system permease protein
MTTAPIKPVRAPQKKVKAFKDSKVTKIVAPFAAIGILLVIWQLLCSSPEAHFPGPIQVVTQSWNLIIDPFFDKGVTNKGLFWQVLASLQRVAWGFSLAALVGISLGILVGTTPLLNDGLDPLFQLLRTIPPLAWLPISLAAFRQANTSAIFVIFITSIWPILLNTITGVQQIPQDYINVSKVLKLSRKEYFFNIVFPATVPYIFTGLRIAIGLSWLAIIAAEMIVGGVGIGFFMFDAWNSAKITDIIVALVYVGVVGLLLDRLMSAIADKVVPKNR